MMALRTELITACQKAHAETALRGNMSHHALILAAYGSEDYFKAIAAALMTVGGIHAPLRQTYELLSCDDPVMRAMHLLHDGKRVPGWGNGFVKDGPDPAWRECAALVEQENPDLAETIESITRLVSAQRKPLYPNPSCYTAATALCSGMPVEACGYLFLSGRLEAWTREFVRVVTEQGRKL